MTPPHSTNSKSVKTTASIEQLAAHCETNPLDGAAWTLLSTLYGQTGRFSDAIVAARKAIALSPENIDAHTNLANALAANGEYDAALAQFDVALKLAPDNPAILTNLAVAHLHAGSADTGIRLLHETIIRHPKFTNAHFQLANIHFSRNEFQKAEQHYRNVIASTADHHGALSLLGVCLANQGKTSNAVQCLLRAVDLYPENVDYLLRLSAIYLEVGNINGALHFSRKTIRLAPDRPETHCALADCLVASAELEQALEQYRKAQALSPDYTKALEGEAGILERLGRTADAYGILRRLIDSKCLQVSGARLYARICQRIGDCEEAADILERIADDVDSHPHEKVVAHFALGDLFDKLARYDDAFRYYRTGNMMQNYTYQRTADIRFVDDMLRSFSKTAYRKAARSRIHSKRPVFILGMPRSGTTLLEQMLANHPDVTGGGELEHIDLFVKKLQASSGYPMSLRGIDRAAMEAMAERYLESLSSLSPDAKRVTDKMPANFRHIPLIRLMFPEAHIIHCVRDAMDTCLSNYFQRFNASLSWATDLSDIAVYYGLYRRCMDHWRNTLGIEFLDIKYENLVSNQEATLRAVLDYIGLPWNSRCLKFHESGRAVATASLDQVRQPIYSTSVSRWKHYAHHLAGLESALT